MTKTVVTAVAGLGVVLAGPAADPVAGPASVTDTALAVAGVGCLAACLVLSIWMLSRRAAAPARG